MSWINLFKLCHGILKIQKAGESSVVDVEVVRESKEGKLQDILSRYNPKDFFNADDTEIFFKLLPDNSLGFKGMAYHGSKQPKTRILPKPYYQSSVDTQMRYGPHTFNFISTMSFVAHGNYLILCFQDSSQCALTNPKICGDDLLLE